MLRLVPLVLAGLVLAGCGSTYRYPHYDVALDGVAEAGAALEPAVPGSAGGPPSFTDGDVRIAGRLTHRYIAVEMTNLTDRTISLVWDRASITNLDGISCRAVRGQTRLLFTDRPQPAGPIPPGGTLSEWAFPETEVELGLPRPISCAKKEVDRRLREAAEQAERGFRITLPVQVEDEVREYALRFRVDHLTFDLEPEPVPPSFK